ncbi:MAG: hypothetical protein COV76_07050 [Candidatus Omnitrophica bacterium CG11_big_fil_rev_8_21_14_0_20_64_10]|nr:MAG: hypothetical protein COV76_07050 [Candidatus Omnitrophica bacterium CG11_big_fil_rev_8_21_14_0_20_64_10]
MTLVGLRWYTLFGEKMMPTTEPRIQVAFPKDIRESLLHIAKEEDIPLAQVVRDVVSAFLELAEDISLADLAESRLKSFRRDDAMSTKEMLKWNQRRMRKR